MRVEKKSGNGMRYRGMGWVKWGRVKRVEGGTCHNDEPGL